MSIEDIAVVERQRFPELEGLRGVLALWVLLYHCIAIGGVFNRLPKKLSAILDGANAVDVFILLSGFVVTLLIIRKSESYRVFLGRRFMRLAPVFYIALVLAFLVQSTGLMPTRFSSSDFPTLMMAHLVLLHGAIPSEIVPHASGAFLNPSWSISLEWQFYLVAPFLVGVLLRGRWIFAAASVVCLIVYRVLGPHAVGFEGSFLPFKIHYFWVGIVSAIAFQKLPPSRISPQILHWLAWAGLMAAPIFLAMSVGLIIWGTVMVVLTAPADDRLLNWIRRLLGSGPVQWLGLISYPAYLLHEPLIWLVLGLLKALGLNPVAALAVGTPLVIAATLACAHYLHYWLEDPINQLVKRWASRTAATKATYP